MKTTRLIPVILLLIFIGSTGCRPPATPDADAPSAPVPVTVDIADPAGLEADEVVIRFYEWYIHHVRQPGGSHPLADGTLSATGYLTEELIEQMHATVEGFGVQGGYDLVLCAQDVPDSVRVEESHMEDGRVHVLLGTSFHEHYLQVVLARDGGHWRIADLRCGVPGPVREPTSRPVAGEIPAEEMDTNGWLIYENDEWGFSIRYPTGWVYEAHEAAAGSPPIGPENIKLMVLFMPNEWADRIAQGTAIDPHAPSVAPFSLEVSVGSMDAYRDAYFTPDHSETVMLGEHEAVREEERYSESARVVRYMVQDPRDEDKRLTLIDYTSGFADRLPGNEEYVAAFRAMIDTLRFIAVKGGR